MIVLPKRSFYLFFMLLCCSTRPCTTAGSLELANPFERSHSNCRPGLEPFTPGSALRMTPWGLDDMRKAGKKNNMCLILLEGFKR